MPARAPVPDEPARAALRRQVRAAWQRCRRHLPEAAAGSTDGLHDTRLALRELRTLLKILAPLAADTSAPVAQAGLTRLNLALSAVRDVDVITDLLARKKIKAVVKHKRLMTTLSPALQADKLEGLHRINRFLAGADWAATRRLATRLVAVELQPRSTGKNQPTLSTFARSAVMEAGKRLHRLVPLARSSKPGKLHRLRIAIRRYRILLDLYAPVLAPGTTRSARAYRRCERRLGRVHDVDMAQAWLVKHRYPQALRSALARRRKRLLRKFTRNWREARTTSC